MTEKMDWCRLGEVSAPYDELLPAGSTDRRAFPAAGDVAGECCWLLASEDGVSLRRGGDTDCDGVGGEWWWCCCCGPPAGPNPWLGDRDPSVLGGAWARLGAGCILRTSGGTIYSAPERIIVEQVRGGGLVW